MNLKVFYEMIVSGWNQIKIVQIILLYLKLFGGLVRFVFIAIVQVLCRQFKHKKIGIN